MVTVGSRPFGSDENIAAVGIIPACAGLYENGFGRLTALTRRWSNAAVLKTKRHIQTM